MLLHKLVDFVLDINPLFVCFVNVISIFIGQNFNIRRNIRVRKLKLLQPVSLLGVSLPVILAMARGLTTLATVTTMRVSGRITSG